MTFSIENIKFGKNRTSAIFSDTAKEAAEKIVKNGNNTTTQMRRFYDELVMWNEKIQIKPINERESEFKNLEPFIKMMKAKVAYAVKRSSSNVDDEFKDVFDACLDQVNSAETLRDAKLFMEAVIGYCRYLGK